MELKEYINTFDLSDLTQLDDEEASALAQTEQPLVIKLEEAAYNVDEFNMDPEWSIAGIQSPETVYVVGIPTKYEYTIDLTSSDVQYHDVNVEGGHVDNRDEAGRDDPLFGTEAAGERTHFEYKSVFKLYTCEKCNTRLNHSHKKWHKHFCAKRESAAVEFDVNEQLLVKKPFKCNLCDKRCISSYLLRLHKKECHAE